MHPDCTLRNGEYLLRRKRGFAQACVAVMLALSMPGIAYSDAFTAGIPAEAMNSVLSRLDMIESRLQAATEGRDSSAGSDAAATVDLSRSFTPVQDESLTLEQELAVELALAKRYELLGRVNNHYAVKQNGDVLMMTKDELEQFKDREYRLIKGMVRTSGGAQLLGSEPASLLLTNPSDPSAKGGAQVAALPNPSLAKAEAEAESAKTNEVNEARERLQAYRENNRQERTQRESSINQTGYRATTQSSITNRSSSYRAER